MRASRKEKIVYLSIYFIKVPFKNYQKSKKIPQASMPGVLKGVAGLGLLWHALMKRRDIVNDRSILYDSKGRIGKCLTPHLNEDSRLIR